MFENLSEKTLVNYKTHFELKKMVQQQQVVASYCIASSEFFLSNSRYLYEITAPIREPRYSIFSDYSIIPTSHLYICMCEAQYNTTRKVIALKKVLRSKIKRFSEKKPKKKSIFVEMFRI